MHKILFLLTALTIFPGTVQGVFAQNAQAQTAQPEKLSETQKIEKLIGYIRSLEGAVFIRNSSEFKPEKAAEHLASKWQKHSRKIATAEDFVLKLASESSSGTPYSIRFTDGTVSTTRELLLEVLQGLDRNN